MVDSPCRTPIQPEGAVHLVDVGAMWMREMRRQQQSARIGAMLQHFTPCDTSLLGVHAHASAPVPQRHLQRMVEDVAAEASQCASG